MRTISMLILACVAFFSLLCIFAKAGFVWWIVFFVSALTFWGLAKEL